MKDTEVVELVCRLIERSDSARASYANRAAIVLAANALVLTTVAALIDKRTPHFKVNIVLFTLMVGSLSASCCSVALALKAAVGQKKDSNTEANFPPDRRFLFNARDTFKLAEANEFASEHNESGFQQYKKMPLQVIQIGCWTMHSANYGWPTFSSVVGTTN
jgi:hypothetical protein